MLYLCLLVFTFVFIIAGVYDVIMSSQQTGTSCFVCKVWSKSLNINEDAVFGR